MISQRGCECVSVLREGSLEMVSGESATSTDKRVSLPVGHGKLMSQCSLPCLPSSIQSVSKGVRVSGSQCSQRIPWVVYAGAYTHHTPYPYTIAYIRELVPGYIKA